MEWVSLTDLCPLLIIKFDNCSILKTKVLEAANILKKRMNIILSEVLIF